MKKVYMIFISLMVVIFIVGCGSDSDNSTKDETTQSQTTTDTEINLKIGESVVVYKGDQVIPLNEDAKIEVIHTIDEDTKQVTLIEGSAKIVRGQVFIENNN